MTMELPAAGIEARGTLAALRRLATALAREPICRFFAIAGLLFVLEKGFRPYAGKKIIIVDDQALTGYLARRLNVYDRQALGIIAGSMETPERDTLVRDYVRDEVLYREAVARDLDKNDVVIRNRLLEKMSYLAAPDRAISDAEAQTYYERHGAQYTTPVRVTIQQVFFDAAKRGRAAAGLVAERMLREMSRTSQSILAKLPEGDSFPLGQEIGPVSVDDLRQLFGGAMATTVFGMPDGQWRGPFVSPAGSHLVRIIVRIPSRKLTYDEVKQQVMADARHAKTKAELERMADDLAGDYAVEVHLTVPNQ